MTTGILSPTHLLVVLLVALVVLGPKRLPGAGKAIGQGIREFRDSIGGLGAAEPPAGALFSGSELATAPAPLREDGAASTGHAG